MTFAQQQGADRVITVAVDTPFFPNDFVSQMTQVAAPIAVAQSGGRVHPACGIWSVSLISDLETYLMSGERRLWGWAMSHVAVPVDWPAQPWDPFFNINTPDDYAAAMTKLAD
jgi:molybdopterin-guanine dinucleotide biosynthesis protein A